MRHTYEAVYQFQLELFQFLKDRFGEQNIKKIFFFSDGAASQYKNKKNLYQMCQFSATQKFSVEWHFFATSHGKGPCDGIGGSFKRNAVRASLQRTIEGHITNATELYEWAISQPNSIVEFRFCAEADFLRIEKEWKPKWDKLCTLKGTQHFHSFIPITGNKIKALRFSTSNESETFEFKFKK